jgi:hypothetical protein
MGDLADPGYKYMNQDQIPRQLECSICLRPFESPVSVNGCEHSFCEQCINSWLDHERTCSICRQEIPSSSTTPGYSKINTRIVRDLLDALLVQCKLCDQTNIERGHWKDHQDVCLNELSLSDSDSLTDSES